MTNFDFRGRTVLITGGAGGLGRACAETFGEGGATVVLADREGSDFDGVRATLAQGPGEVHTIGTDLSDIDNCKRLPQQACTAAGVERLDVLVNAVGLMRTTPFRELQPEQWQQSIAVNLTGIFTTMQAAAEVMDAGSIVTLASVAARSGRANAADYAAAKAGLLSLTKSAALALGPEIRVNAVCPGVFLTDMWSGIIRDRDAKFGPGAGERYLAEQASKAALQRHGEPRELAAAVAFLASDYASFITGQALNVDGGLEMD